MLNNGRQNDAEHFRVRQLLHGTRMQEKVDRLNNVRGVNRIMIHGLAIAIIHGQQKTRQLLLLNIKLVDQVVRHKQGVSHCVQTRMIRLFVQLEHGKVPIGNCKKKQEETF